MSAGFSAARSNSGRVFRGSSSTSQLPRQPQVSMSNTSRDSSLLEAFDRVKQQVAEAGGDRQVRLVAVSKRKPASDILTIYRATGHTHFGENYVNELQEKAKELPLEIQWHFIGALQTNKCKLLAEIPNLFAVETVDSLKKAQLLEKARGELGARGGAKEVEIYLQVNTSSEQSKAGFVVGGEEAMGGTELYRTAKYIQQECGWLKLAGLMTIGSIAESRSKTGTNREFLRLAEVRDGLAGELSLDRAGVGLSMGMSAEFELAIKMGSDNVRVGSSIFGERV